MLKVANSVISASRITGVLPVVNGGTGVTTSTGTGSTVLSAAPTLSGDVNLSTGNLVIGTAGKGIDFSVTGEGSGTMTSELLADYEEGTWTPAITGWTSISYANQNGNYTKIGNQVTAWFYIVFSGTSSASNVQIANLPYTVGAAATSGGSMSYYDAPLNETSGVVVYPGSTTTTISLYQDNDSGTAVQSNGNAVGNYLTGSVTYRV